MSTIRERDALNADRRDSAAADRRALLAALDALVEAVGPANPCPCAHHTTLRAAITRAKGITDG